MNKFLNEYFGLDFKWIKFWMNSVEIFLNWILNERFFSIIQRSIEFSISIAQGYLTLAM